MLAQLGFESTSGFNLSLIVSCVVFLAALATLLAFGFQFFRSDRLESRLKAVADRKKQLIQAQRAGFQVRSRLQVAPEGGLKALALKSFRLQNILDAKDLRSQLARAGHRNPSAVVNYIIARIAT